MLRETAEAELRNAAEIHSQLATVLLGSARSQEKPQAETTLLREALKEKRKQVHTANTKAKSADKAAEKALKQKKMDKKTSLVANE